jgi:hypothetical protein
VQQHLFVARRACRKVRPRRRVPPKRRLLLRRQLGRVRLLVGVDGGFAVGALRKRLRPCGQDAALRLQGLVLGDVDRTPDRPTPPGREPHRIRHIVQAPAHPINPPTAQRLIHRLRPRHARVTRIDLAKAYQQLIRDACIDLEPSAKGLGGIEELWGGHA